MWSLQSFPGRKPLLLAGTALLILALPACAISLPVSRPADRPPYTAGQSPKRSAPLSLPGLNEEDWRRAQGVIGLALEPSGNGLRVRWDNPATGREGSIAPAAPPIVREGRICRAFLATIEEPRHVAQIRGMACQNAGHDWEVTELVR
ncbi:hypothetical protein H0176_26845 [Methylorubrum populi]|uniref:RT0821/Lpp0805 family surface protein n=1 Tax=Methylorubrum rhodesianum TaxID=29427 RepID=UPI00190D37AA|nr:RT0821/Lpp0805 family surface protein [Methylorubrum rhodesianum]MBK3406644.1 hypothetical protein [Methylorubrum rhodesianum]MBY0143848.1 hypothetical protein [Methylorubrum populi]